MSKTFLKKENIKPVLNFNFSTHILFRCIQRKYANDFIKGKFRFNQPKSWIEMEKQGNKGQGDSLEGVFLATKQNDNFDFIFPIERYQLLQTNGIELTEIGRGKVILFSESL